MRALGQQLRDWDSVGPGFDAVRVSLALLVVAYHSPWVVGLGHEALGPFWLAGELIVPAFFVVSGFLVTASAARLDAWQFVIHRILRIMPAFTLMIAVSALLVGPVLTTLPLQDYFSSPQLGRYFLELVGASPSNLPGVFDNNRGTTTFNMSVWSIRWEVGCYLFVAAAATLGLVRRPRLLLVAAVAIIVVPPLLYLALYAGLIGGGSEEARRLVTPDGFFWYQPIEQVLRGRTGVGMWFAALLVNWIFRGVPFFFAGVAAYICRDKILYSRAAAIAAAAIIGLASALCPETWNNPLVYFAMALPLTIVVLTLGLSPLSLPLPFRNGDYSYGIYLFAFPVQQMLAQCGADRGEWALNAMLTMPIATILAIFSWHFVEQPMLATKSVIAGRFKGNRMVAQRLVPASSG